MFFTERNDVEPSSPSKAACLLPITWPFSVDNPIPKLRLSNLPSIILSVPSHPGSFSLHVL